jgi:hypothetical protein
VRRHFKRSANQIGEKSLPDVKAADHHDIVHAKAIKT